MTSMKNSSKDPDDLSAYNVPFAGVTVSELARARLRLFKRELRENPGVNQRYIRAGVREFLRPMQGIIDGIPRATTLIVMPSTSGVNRIPAMLAEGIKKLRPDIEVVSSKDRLIYVAHKTESKYKDRHIDRLDDPRSFVIDDSIQSAATQLNRSSLILDDSISTGDSAITLHRQLLKKGISVQGIVTAVTGTKYHVRHSDIDRLFEKIKDVRPVGYSADELKGDMYTTFAGYPDSKIKRIELALVRSSRSQLYNRPDLVLHLIRSTSAYLQKEQLGASDMVALRKQISPTLTTPPVMRPVRGTKPKL